MGKPSNTPRWLWVSVVSVVVVVAHTVFTEVLQPDTLFLLSPTHNSRRDQRRHLCPQSEMSERWMNALKESNQIDAHSNVDRLERGGEKKIPTNPLQDWHTGERAWSDAPGCRSTLAWTHRTYALCRTAQCGTAEHSKMRCGTAWPSVAKRGPARQRRRAQCWAACPQRRSHLRRTITRISPDTCGLAKQGLVQAGTTSIRREPG